MLDWNTPDLLIAEQELVSNTDSEEKPKELTAELLATKIETLGFSARYRPQRNRNIAKREERDIGSRWKIV